MHVVSIVAVLSLVGATRGAETAPLDLRALAQEAAAEIVAQEVLHKQPSTPADMAEIEARPGYFRLVGEGMSHPPELVYVAASVADIWSRQELQKVCAANPLVTCEAGWPSSPEMDAAVSAGVYAGVKGVQRLAHKYWGVDLDDGWKELLIFGGISAVRGFYTWRQVQDANAVREFGR